MATLIWSSANNSTDKTSIVVPVGTLLENTAYEIRARHKGNITGYGAYGTKTINTLSSFGTTNAPVVSVSGSPVSVTETPTITTNPFSVSSGTDTLESTDWQVYNGATLVWESLANTTDKLSITVPAGLLLAGIAYTFKARHNGTVTGASAYGSKTATTLSSFGEPNAPTITVTGELNSVPETPTITLSAFSMTSGNDTHLSTDYEIWRV